MSISQLRSRQISVDAIQEWKPLSAFSHFEINGVVFAYLKNRSLVWTSLQWLNYTQGAEDAPLSWERKTPNTPWALDFILIQLWYKNSFERSLFPLGHGLLIHRAIPLRNDCLQQGNLEEALLHPLAYCLLQFWILGLGGLPSGLLSLMATCSQREVHWCGLQLRHLLLAVDFISKTQYPVP